MAKRILIVDDSSSNLLLLSNFLESEGYDVTTCFSGKDALKKLKDQCPDLLLLDLMMPGVGGLEVLQTVRSDAGLMNLPVIVISAVGEDEMVSEVQALGVADYMVKPIDFDLIYQRVLAILG